MALPKLVAAPHIHTKRLDPPPHRFYAGTIRFSPNEAPIATIAACYSHGTPSSFSLSCRHQALRCLRHLIVSACFLFFFLCSSLPRHVAIPISQNAEETHRHQYSR